MMAFKFSNDKFQLVYNNYYDIQLLDFSFDYTTN